LLSLSPGDEAFAVSLYLFFSLEMACLGFYIFFQFLTTKRKTIEKRSRVRTRARL